MIAKHVDREPENDNYRALAIYCEGGHAQDNEKVLDKWYAGGLTDDYFLGMIEVEATQALNKTSAQEKTYHLVLSFRPEDEARLTPGIYREIEAEFAKALGYQNHQRHIGVHQNTNNMHMHVAYNMIHPDTFNRHEMKGDYYALSKTCREIERRYGLVVDPGIEQADGLEKISAKAKTVEAKTGQQSFQSYVTERKDSILEVVEAAAQGNSWQILHEALAKRGMKIKHISGGLTIINPHGKGAIKASGIDRSLSKGNLEKRLGAFEASQVQLNQVQVVESYEAKPLHKGLERQERAELYGEYKIGIDKRIEMLESIKTAEKEAKERERKHWQKQRESFEGNTLLIRKDKAKLQQLAKMHEIEALRKLSDRFDRERDAVKSDVPYGNWNDYLQLKAREGNEAALATLRSQNKDVQPERDAGASVFVAQRRAAREKWQNLQAGLRLNQDLSIQDKRSLVSVAKMRQLDELTSMDTRKSNPFAGFKYEIDAQGIVMFRLASGGSLRDTGKELYFSANDKTAQEAALLFAQAKWGKSVKIDGNKLTADFTPKVDFEKTPGKTKKNELNKQTGHGL